MIAGVDIGGTKIALGLVNDAGKVVTRFDIPVDVDRGPANARDGMLKVMRQLKSDGGFTGIGIGCTGPTDPITGELGDVNTLPGWQGWNPVEELADAFRVRVALENDADLLISNATDPKIRNLIPDWHKALLPDAKSFIVLPLVIQKKAVGLFYADRTEFALEGVPADETALIKTLKGQVLGALNSH